MRTQQVKPTSDGAQRSDDVVKPPLPRWAYRIVNPTLTMLLRSPFHRLLSNALLLLRFQGRRSGKRYTIPVGYVQQGQRVYIFSHARWWKNLPGQQVTIRLRGRDVCGMARRLEAPDEIAAMVHLAQAQRGTKMVERMGLLEYTQAQRSESLPQRTTFFEITLDEVRG